MKLKSIKKQYNIKVKEYSKKFNLDLGYFLNTGFWSFSLLLFDLILGFLLSYSVANYMEKVEAGKYFFFLALMGLFSVFSLNGFLTMSTNEFLKKNYTIYFQVVKIKMLGSIIGGIILYFVSLYSYIQNQTIWPLFILTGTLLILNNFNLYTQKLYSEDKMGKISFYTNIKAFIYYLVTIIAIIWGNLDLIYILSIFFGLQILMDFIFFVIEGSTIKQKQKKLTKKNLKEGFLFSVTLISNKILNLDRLLLALIFNLETLAIYAISLILPKTLNQIFSKCSIYIFYKKLKNINILKAWKKIGFFLLVVFIGSITFILIIPSLFEILYPDYSESIIYAQLFMLLIPLNVLSTLFLRLNESSEMPDRNLKVIIPSNVVYLGSLIILCLNFGIVGAVISRFLRDSIKILMNLRFQKII